MNGFDNALLVVIGVLTLAGLLKGITRLSISLAAFVAAFYLAARFQPPVAAELAANFGLSEPVAAIAAYAAVFVGTLLAGAFVARVLRRTLQAAMLGWADRLAGAAAGLIAGLLAAGLVLPVVGRSPAGERLLRESVLAPYAASVAELTQQLLPASATAGYRERMDALRAYWLERRGLPRGTAVPPD